MKKAVLYPIVCLLVACASETQKTGLEMIADHYGAKTSFAKGFNTNAGVTRTNFTVKVSDSKMIDTLRSDLTSSNIALMLYESFDEDERVAFDDIFVEIRRDTVSKADKSSYDPERLKVGLDQAAIFTNFSDNFLGQKFGAISDNMAPEYQNAELASNLSNYWKGLIAQHGRILGYKRIGFGVYTTPKNEKLFYYSGILNFRDGSQRGYSVQTSQNIDDNHLMGFKFDEY
ncbi:hypothetical protein [Allomuricauda sp. SCSIO 65647]|uniref:hypothetical protein n=1 Tax=Allomuricauda sp. SCSIO 65647 TaxID=2908843 RepID=UPI001F205C7B|nr:hypothetical protein [Muricauda sp. SCSIO 65647]UJH66115.1 hypothetical protein L0P89_09025 [Muricauda sp. SCSIO 65647]